MMAVTHGVCVMPTLSKHLLRVKQWYIANVACLPYADPWCHLVNCWRWLQHVQGQQHVKRQLAAYPHTYTMRHNVYAGVFSQWLPTADRVGVRWFF